MHPPSYCQGEGCAGAVGSVGCGSPLAWEHRWTGSTGAGEEGWAGAGARAAGRGVAGAEVGWGGGGLDAPGPLSSASTASASQRQRINEMDC